MSPLVKQGEAPASPLPRGERGGKRVKGLSGASLDARRGQRPLLPLVQNGGEAADLINTAQVTPLHRDRLRERARRSGKVRRRMRLYPVKEVYRVAALGMGRGFEMRSPTAGEWNLAPGCEKPVPVQMDGAPAILRGAGYVRAPGKPFGLTLWTKCRRCADCLRRRRNLWAYRAQEEIKLAARTWFATFTLNPHWHAVMRMRASVRLADRGSNLEMLPGDDVGAEVSAEYRRELTLYFKRLRKQTGAQLRYILVQEQHKSGLPHFHALIHEVRGTEPVTHASLTSGWKLGYTKFKLVQAVQTAWYVAKYLAKEVNNRVRASLHYGSVKDALKHSETELPRDEHPPQNETLLGPSQTALSAALRRSSGQRPASPIVERITQNALRRLLLRQEKAGETGAASEPSPGSPEALGTRTQAEPADRLGAEPSAGEAASTFNEVHAFFTHAAAVWGLKSYGLRHGRASHREPREWLTSLVAVHPLDAAKGG